MTLAPRQFFIVHRFVGGDFPHIESEECGCFPWVIDVSEAIKTADDAYRAVIDELEEDGR